MKVFNPFLKDSIGIRADNGSFLVVRKDDVQKLIELLRGTTMEPEFELEHLESVAQAIYETSPTGDQPTDWDGRCTGPGYVYTWQDVKDSLPATYEAAIEAARKALVTYYAN